ncbi:PhzF family phenazine biosynthesis protein [Promethearchaeum syntrophicum]|uniref:PhzF family phenazine biosynthesis protein n=1 Tax=Promethearchaeum syntrophicum TaxID=2594042 RepID=A0AC61ZTY2_9ARCH
MKIPVYYIDAFTKTQFKGNPAAVCLINNVKDSKLSFVKRQAIANEINFAETAFVTPIDIPDWKKATKFKLQWFTPEVEVNLCGHATLATGFVLSVMLGNPSKVLSFETKSGELNTIYDNGQIQMIFPISKNIVIDLKEELDVIDNLASKEILSAVYNSSLQYLLIEVKSKEVLTQFSPNPSNLLSCSFKFPLSGLILTCKGELSSDFDFYFRFFAPWMGILEDPVTGSAATVVGPFWKKKLKKNKFTTKQLSRRTGTMILEIIDENQIKIIGHATKVLEGTLNINGDKHANL